MIVSAKARYANVVPKPLEPRYLDDGTVVDVPISEVHPTGKGTASIMGLLQGTPQRGSPARSGRPTAPRGAELQARPAPPPEGPVSGVGGLPQSADPGRELAP